MRTEQNRTEQKLWTGFRPLLLSVGVSVLCIVDTQGQTSGFATDDFENGTIDNSLWETGGGRRGYSGYNAGTWQWSHTETSGALQVRVWGPATGGAYLGEGWVRTKFDYNNGQNHLINFTWGASVNANHVDAFAIEICNGDIYTDVGTENNYTWFWDDTATNKNLYLAADKIGGGPGQPNLSPTAWSIRIDASTRTATLYNGPNLTGSVFGQKTLEAVQPWYLRFIQCDGTSAGYPAGDNSLFLYDFSSTALFSLPVIVTQPQHQMVWTGQHVTLSVVATGYPLPKFQWFLNNIAIAGATGSVYSIATAQSSDAGLYSVMVSNELGSVTSAVASCSFARMELIGSVVIEGVVGQTYRVEYSSNLEPSGWATLTEMALPSSPYRVIDWESAGLPRRFYRVVQLP